MDYLAKEVLMQYLDEREAVFLASLDREFRYLFGKMIRTWVGDYEWMTWYIHHNANGRIQLL